MKFLKKYVCSIEIERMDLYLFLKYGEFEGERKRKIFYRFLRHIHLKDFHTYMHGLKIRRTLITEMSDREEVRKMAEFTSAEKVNIGYENEYSTDAMTGGPDKRRQLYYQLIQSMKKAESVDIIVSFSYGIRSENVAERTGTYFKNVEPKSES